MTNVSERGGHPPAVHSASLRPAHQGPIRSRIGTCGTDDLTDHLWQILFVVIRSSHGRVSHPAAWVFFQKTPWVYLLTKTHLQKNGYTFIRAFAFELSVFFRFSHNFGHNTASILCSRKTLRAQSLVIIRVRQIVPLRRARS